MLMTDSDARQNHWVMILGQLKWCRLYLIFFNYSHFYFSVGQLTQMFYVTTRFSALQDTQKNYMTTSTSRSLTFVWEAQNPIKQVMNHPEAKHMRPCLWKLWVMESKTFSYISAISYFMEINDNLTLPLSEDYSLYLWENSLCKWFFILCQMNPIKPIQYSLVAFIDFWSHSQWEMYFTWWCHTHYNHLTNRKF